MTKPPASNNADASVDGHLSHLMGFDLSPIAAQAINDIDQVMGRIRKSMARREMVVSALRDLKLDIDAADFDILLVLGSSPDEAGETTVGSVAERLNIDPSRASRIAADAVDKGLIRRVASQADARRIGLELTEAGRAHALRIRAYKWKIFAEALHHWPEEDLVTFARLFDRFGHSMADAKAKACKP